MRNSESKGHQSFATLVWFWFVNPQRGVQQCHADLRTTTLAGKINMRVILGVLIGGAIGFLVVYYLKSGHLPF